MELFTGLMEMEQNFRAASLIINMQMTTVELFMCQAQFTPADVLSLITQPRTVEVLYMPILEVTKASLLLRVCSGSTQQPTAESFKLKESLTV